MDHSPQQHWGRPQAGRPQAGRSQAPRPRFNSLGLRRSAAPTTRVAPTAKSSDNRLSPLDTFRAMIEELGPSVKTHALCDRCGQVLKVPVPKEWLGRLERDKDRYPLPSNLTPRSWEAYLGDTHLRISSQVCPGNENGTCLTKRTHDDIKTWGELKALPETSPEVDQEWLQLDLPSAVGYLAAPDWQEKLQSAVINASRNDPPESRLSKSWVNYIYWRCAWLFFSLRKGGLRHENAKLERMWGQVDVDILLLEYGVLEKADLEALYCTSYSSLAGLISCKWLYGSALLNMFFGIRRDIGKDQFNQLKRAVQRADTAMGKYLLACVNMDAVEWNARRRAAFTAYRHVEEHLHHYASTSQLREFFKLRQSPPPPSAELLEESLAEKGAQERTMLIRASRHVELDKSGNKPDWVRNRAQLARSVPNRWPRWESAGIGRLHAR
ncbi:hypothetical protein CABS01_13559 [Colletotrichum abscissum]|uniref:Uncharacterized protein n=1 Tax=Colletotrichum abscissum TaxID=1671311 RepID=A0A9Q0AY87_9PEZI|nr:uncharacterized protein CABS01_13559 [Colletotrichum abscissum]KAI3534867.1 hypothetical protein CABS02_13080 [Colletotrichum abscissum]KAK1485264.1 hypothetical protein CABS01_13559 [Colletotrichum abscissum]